MRKLSLDVVTFTNPDSIIAEQYRIVRTNIEQLRKSENFQTLLLTSANSGEGKTTTILNLSVIFAKAGVNVLLVDCDLRKRSLTQNFHLENSNGVVSIIDGSEPLVDCVYQTNVPNLDFLASGYTITNPAELLLDEKLNGLITEMKVMYDLILFDTPPIEAVSDALILTPKLDGCILIVREGYSEKDAIRRTKHALDGVETNIVGVIHNDVSISKTDNYGYGYGYGSGNQKRVKKSSMFKFFK